MQIVICDDDRNELSKINKIITDYAEKHNDLMIKVKSFSNSFELLNEISRSGAPDIALLDICMPGVMGTEIAKELKRINNDVTDIIFLTSSSDYAVDAFALRAKDYIKKPYTEKQLTEALDRVISARQNHVYTLIKCEKEVYRVDLYDVVYAETRHSIVEIHFKSGQTLQTRMTLTRFAEIFEGIDGFNMMGASFFINFRCVKSIRKDNLEMITGEILPIPRRLKNDLKLQLFDFYKKETIN